MQEKIGYLHGMQNLDLSALISSVFIVVLMTPIIPIDRIDHLSGIAEIWILSNMGIIGSFIGFNQLAKRGVKHGRE